MDQDTSASPPHAAATTRSIAGDTLYGADEIALFMYGSADHRRKVYNLVQAERLPIFRLGATLCARKSILLGWIASQERPSDSN